MPTDPKPDKTEPKITDKPVKLIDIVKKDGTRPRQCAEIDLKSFRAAGYVARSEFDKKPEG